MPNLIWEDNVFGANPGTKDICRHLFTRMSCGRVVIVATNPINLLGPLRKQWLKLARKVQKERASTFHGERIYELTGLVARMQSLRFKASWPDYDQADVYVVSLEQVLQWAPECRTLYVTCDITLEQLHIISALVPKGGSIIKCVFKAS